MRYVSPIDPAAAAAVDPAPRPESVAGRTVALLDISKNRGAAFLDRLERHLRGMGADVERFAKPLFSRPASAELIQTIRARADLAVEGLAD